MATVILLPPSQGKADGGSGPPWERAATAFPELTAERRRVRDAVRAALRAGDGVAERLLGARGDTLARALADWEALDDARTLPAAARYRGVVWEALAPATLSPAGRRRLGRRVLVPSGLWGVLAAGDAVPPYRLAMGASPPGLGRLSTWWRPLVTAAVARRAGAAWVIDMLPAEHAAAIEAAALGRARLMRVEIVEEAEGGTRAVGHAGKALKGRLARAILEADARTPAAVAALEVPGLRRVAVHAPRGGAARVAFAPDPPSPPARAGGPGR
ncbi:MAG TPA: peroxide stress protein YaaA [Miltoncostaeaceae bacterium]|nr:peroxide stress protein YaaA [Miltoncostaeaceae bacterium]